jgi:hypothetical protein
MRLTLADKPDIRTHMKHNATSIAYRLHLSEKDFVDKTGAVDPKK